MRKICFLIISAIILAFSFTTAAVFESDNETFYLSDNELRESIYTATQDKSFGYYLWFQEQGLRIIKESITPIYTIDMLNYAKNETYVIKPLLIEDDSKNPWQAYVAKTITEDNLYGGNLYLRVQNGKVHSMGFSPSIHIGTSTDSRYSASVSYADHAERIKNILNLDSIVSPDNVRFLLIDQVGRFFYVNIESGQYFIPIGFQIKDGRTDNYEIDVCLTVSDMKKIAQNSLELYKLRQEDYIKWQQEHPGEELPDGEYGLVDPISSACSQVDNILNISEYLGIDMTAGVSDDGGQAASADKLQKALFIIIPACVLLAAAFTFICIKKRKKA